MFDSKFSKLHWQHSIRGGIEAERSAHVFDEIGAKHDILVHVN